MFQDILPSTDKKQGFKVNEALTQHPKQYCSISGKPMEGQSAFAFIK